MRAIPGGSITVFLLFFGISLIDAAWSRNWLRAALWFGFGLLFVAADLLAWRRQRRSN